MPGAFGGGGGGGTTEVKNEPWGAAQPYLKDILDQAEGIYYGGGPEYYPYSTVAPLSGYSSGAVDWMGQRAMQGSPLLTAGQQSMYDLARGAYMGGGPAGSLFEYTAEGGFTNPALQYLSDTAEGAYLNANPYIDEAYGNAAENLTDIYEQAVNQTNLGFARSGQGPGSPAWEAARLDTAGELAEGLGDLSQDYYYRNYADERNKQLAAQGRMGNLWGQDVDRRLGAGQTLENLYGRDMGYMMGAAAAAPGMAAADYGDIERLGQAGSVLDRQRQQEILDAQRRWDFYQTGQGSPYGHLERYANLAYPASGFGSTQETPYYDSTFSNLLSVGLLGAGLFF